MHYGIIAIGSRGDVQPYIALALGLMDRGHRVTIMAYENFEEFVKSYNLEFHPLHNNIEQVIYSAEGKKILRSGNAFSMLRYIRKAGAPRLKQVCRDIFEGCEAADVLITSVLGVPWVATVAERQQKKWATDLYRFRQHAHSRSVPIQERFE